MPIGWYPRSANKKDLYVYLNTLSSDNSSLYASAKSLVNINGIIDNPKEGIFYDSIEFLKSAALSERTKEINFLKSKGYDIPVSKDFDYIGFIKILNEQIADFNNFKTRIEIEKNRRGVKGPGSHSYTQAMGSYTGAIMRQLQGGPRKMTTIAGVVRSSLIKIAKEKLKGITDINQISSILGMMQSQLMPQLTKELTKDGSLAVAAGIKKEYTNEKGNIIKQQAIEDLIKQTDLYKQIFENSSEQELTSIANNILNKYSITLSKKAKNILRKTAQNLPKIKNSKKIDWTAVLKETNYNQYLKGLSAEDIYTYSFERNTGMGGEAQNYIDSIKQSLITSWSGGQGGKADTVSLVGNIVLKENNKISSNFLEGVVGNITNKTQSHFQEINNKIRDAYLNIDKELQIISEENEKMENSFILHTSVKDYMTTQREDSFSGFQGGNYQGLDIIDSIATLSESGFSSADIDWLKVCLLNTADAAVGGGNREALETYLSVFASMLLFDDGALIAQQAKNNLSLTNLSVLHLFMLNGVYVPASFLMSTIASRLEASAADASKAVKVNINPGAINFAEQLTNLSENEVWNYHRWEAIREIQIAAMKVRIDFLASFNQIINAL